MTLDLLKNGKIQFEPGDRVTIRMLDGKKLTCTAVGKSPGRKCRYCEFRRLSEFCPLVSHCQDITFLTNPTGGPVK
jgi:hypothetical protein